MYNRETMKRLAEAKTQAFYAWSNVQNPRRFNIAYDLVGEVYDCAVEQAEAYARHGPCPDYHRAKFAYECACRALTASGFEPDYCNPFSRPVVRA